MDPSRADRLAGHGAPLSRATAFLVQPEAEAPASSPSSNDGDTGRDDGGRRAMHARGLSALGLLLGLMAAVSPAAVAPWRSVAPGLDVATFVARSESPSGDGQVTVLRIDPAQWELEFAGLSQAGETIGKTAREWCEAHEFTAAINAGMFAEDYKTHLGYLRQGGHVNSNRVIDSYQSVAAFGPRGEKKLPPFRIFDLDEPGVTVETIRRDYSLVVQNLRLVKRPASNRWSQQPRRWSEAALGEDTSGRILFIFCRSPFTMYDLNRELLSMGIGLVAAQHLEGGPEAQLYLRSGDEELDLFGSYESSFRENDDNNRAWPIPNVLGIRPRSAAK